MTSPKKSAPPTPPRSRFLTRYPPLHIFNEADEPVGEAMLEEILAKGLLHRVIHVWVEDPDGNILLQLRGPKVGTNPNKWDFATAGYVDAGENYEQTAKRELTEELGLTDFKLHDLGVVRENEVIQGNKVRRFAGVFKAVIPPDTKFKLQKSEVVDVKWFSPGELKRFIAEHPDQVSPYFIKWLRRRDGNHGD